MTSDTPRSDKFWSPDNLSTEWAYFARTLERELNEARANAVDIDRQLTSVIDELNAKLAALERENSKLRSALEIVHFKQEPWQ